MPSFQIAIELRSPALLAAAPPASNLTETLPFIPGNTVRGLLATRFLESGRSPEEAVFGELFVTGEARFGAALPEGAEVLPLSARSCKYSGGFRREGGHGAHDLLLERSRGSTRPRCDACSAPLDYFEGFWHPNAHRSARVDTVLRTRTAIDPQRGTASTGKLFTQRLLAEGQRFVSRIEAPAAFAAELEALLARPFDGRVGTGASRGQGWVEVAPVDGTERQWGPARERFQAFRSAAGGAVLAVTLLSDALFHDVYLRDVTAPGLDDLALLGIRPADWQSAPIRAFTDVRTIFGFDGFPVGLPRVPRVALAAGSTLLFAPRDGKGEPEIPEGEGIGWIGDGNREGYGRAVLWHPFHLAPEPPETREEAA